MSDDPNAGEDESLEPPAATQVSAPLRVCDLDNRDVLDKPARPARGLRAHRREHLDHLAVSERRVYVKPDVPHDRGHSQVDREPEKAATRVAHEEMWRYGVTNLLEFPASRISAARVRWRVRAAYQGMGVNSGRLSSEYAL